MAQGSQLAQSCSQCLAASAERSMALQAATAAAMPVIATLKAQGMPAVATATAMKPLAPSRTREATVTGTAATATSPWA